MEFYDWRDIKASFTDQDKLKIYALREEYEADIINSALEEFRALL